MQRSWPGLWTMKTKFIILKVEVPGMFVCICRAVTEQEVRSAIDTGAKTVQAVTQSCCAGDDCGACHGYIEEMIEDRWGASPDGAVHLPVVTERGRAA
jgi:bacterioferritin-associated ferredoxin